MNRILYYYVCVFLFCFASCNKDLGNYDYNRLPELKVDGIEQDYGTMQLFIDSLVIKPVISFGDEDDSSFEFTWYSHLEDTLLPISHDKDLYLSLDEVGLKKYIFEVVYKELGISSRYSTKVLVSSEMQRGFYILKETVEGGSTDLDGYIRLGKDEYDYYPNLISSKLGQPLEGKPVDLDYWDSNRKVWSDENNEYITIGERVLRPVSEDDIAVFRMSDIAYLGGFSELFFDLEKGDVKFEGLKSIGGASFVFFNSGKVRAMDNTVVSRFLLEFNGDYELEPMICGSYSGQAYVYDKLTSSFKVLGGSSTFLYNCGDYTFFGKYGSMNNLNAYLRFIGRGRGNLPPLFDNKGIGYALLENKDDPDVLLLMHISLNCMWRNMGIDRSNVDQIDTLPKGMNIKRAENYTMHEYQKLLFYNVGNRVFLYDVLKKEEKLIIGESDFPEETGLPDEITYLKYIRSDYDEYEYWFDRLFVGGYKNGNYVLYAYEIVDGKPTGTPMMWSGEGKIKKVVYAAPTVNVTPFYVYQ